MSLSSYSDLSCMEPDEFYKFKPPHLETMCTMKVGRVENYTVLHVRWECKHWRQIKCYWRCNHNC